MVIPGRCTTRGGRALEHKQEVNDKKSDTKISLTFDLYWSFRCSSNYSHPSKSQESNSYDRTRTDKQSQAKEQGR